MSGEIIAKRISAPRRTIALSRMAYPRTCKGAISIARVDSLNTNRPSPTRAN